MKRVLVIVTNRQQASYRLRVDALRPMLLTRGFEFDVQVRPKGWLARRKLLRSAVEYHAVLLQRKLLDPFDARLHRTERRLIFHTCVGKIEREGGAVQRDPPAAVHLQLRLGPRVRAVRDPLAAPRRQELPVVEVPAGRAPGLFQEVR